MNAAQAVLQKQHGTPGDFAQACSKAREDGHMTLVEYHQVTAAYRVTWDRAGKDNIMTTSSTELPKTYQHTEVEGVQIIDIRGEGMSAFDLTDLATTAPVVVEDRDGGRQVRTFDKAMAIKLCKKLDKAGFNCIGVAQTLPDAPSPLEVVGQDWKHEFLEFTPALLRPIVDRLNAMLADDLVGMTTLVGLRVLYSGPDQDKSPMVIDNDKYGMVGVLNGLLGSKTCRIATEVDAISGKLLRFRVIDMKAKSASRPARSPNDPAT